MGLYVVGTLSRTITDIKDVTIIFHKGEIAIVKSTKQLLCTNY